MDLPNRSFTSRIYMARYTGKSENPIIVPYRTETGTKLLNHYELDKNAFWKIIMFGSENHKNCANSEMHRTE